jgi:hypothetical protein
MNATTMPGLLTSLIYLLVIAASAVGIHTAFALTIVPSTGAGHSSTSQSTNSGCLPTHDGYLRARLRGNQRDLDIDWHDADISCEGGRRPDDIGGIRVAFIGTLPQDGQQVRIIFGIRAADDTGHAHNLPANVTLIFESDSSIYSSAGDNRCTIDELSLQSAAEARDGWRRVAARGFCAVPVATLSGNDAIELDRFDFAGGLKDED